MCRTTIFFMVLFSPAGIVLGVDNFGEFNLGFSDSIAYFLFAVLSPIFYSQIKICRELYIEKIAVNIFACEHPLSAFTMFGMLFGLVGGVGFGSAAYNESKVFVLPAIFFCTGVGLILGCYLAQKICGLRFGNKI